MAKIGKMQGPAGVNSANIEGHEYKVPKSGIIDVVSENHIETLKRHGFVEVEEEAEEVDLDSMSKDELIQFCEERGGETDGLKKSELKELARELIEA